MCVCVCVCVCVYTFIVQISNQFLKHIFVSNGPCIEIS